MRPALNIKRRERTTKKIFYGPGEDAISRLGVLSPAWNTLRKLFLYDRYHLDVLIADLACAVLVAAITLVLPLCANFIIKRLTSANDQSILISEIYSFGGVTLLRIGVQDQCLSLAI
jgi:hypothetical protein